MCGTPVPWGQRRNTEGQRQRVPSIEFRGALSQAEQPQPQGDVGLGQGRVRARRAGGGSPPEGNRLPFIPAHKSPSEPPGAGRGRCPGQNGGIVVETRASCSGSSACGTGTGRGRWGAEHGSVGFPSPAQPLSAPAAPTAHPGSFATQILLGAIGIWQGTAQHLAGAAASPQAWTR